MPLPSFYVSGERQRTWSVARAATYGSGLGVLAALFKTVAPLHGTGSAAVTAAAADVLEIAAAAFAFALLCAGAAVLRNFIARRFIWPT